MDYQVINAEAAVNRPIGLMGQDGMKADTTVTSEPYFRSWLTVVVSRH